jgi:hypothetical protein
MVTLEDVVILGMAVPSELKDGRKSVCVAAWQPDHGLIRLYPAKVKDGFHRWQRFHVHAERRSNDNRPESWHLIGDDYIRWRGGKLAAADRRALLESHLYEGCIAELSAKETNANFQSLAVCKPTVLNVGYRSNKSVPKLTQQTFFNEGEWVDHKARFENEPYIEFQCGVNCQTKHRHVVLDWAAFRALAKGGNFWNGVQMHNAEYEHFIIVGNQNNQRTSFVTIAVIQQKAMPLFNGKRHIASEQLQMVW